MPSIEVKATPLEIASTNEFKIGTQVSTWGYPGGYFGLFPMLSVGYLAGIDAFQAQARSSSSGSSMPHSMVVTQAAR